MLDNFVSNVPLLVVFSVTVTLAVKISLQLQTASQYLSSVLHWDIVNFGGTIKSSRNLISGDT